MPDLFCAFVIVAFISVESIENSAAPPARRLYQRLLGFRQMSRHIEKGSKINVIATVRGNQARRRHFLLRLRGGAFILLLLFSRTNDVSNWPFLHPFPSSFISLPSPAPLRGSRSFVLVFEFSLADRLSQIISFNSPCGTKTHSPCNFLIILFPFEAPECRLVRCQLYVPSAGGGNVFRCTMTGLFSQIKGN